MDVGITKENLLLIVPPALTHDPAMMARAAADAEALAARLGEIDRVRVISNIDGLDEAVLDILARDFKVDWWDPEYSIDEKRRTLKGSWRVHKTLGTKAAVETTIRAIYPGTRVLEWFEYGGEPYHFRLDINITNDRIDSDKQRRVLERLNFYKSLRSHNDGVTYFVEAAPALVQAASGVSGLTETVHAALELPVPLVRLTASARVGAAAGMQEFFTACVVLPDTDPPTGTAQIKAAASGAWQEHYTTGEIRLAAQAPAAAAGAGARGAVAARQETAQTTINFNRR